MLKHTFEKVYLSRHSNRLEFVKPHFTSMLVSDIREAFLEEIRPTGIRCFATLVEDISCFATFSPLFPFLNLSYLELDYS